MNECGFIKVIDRLVNELLHRQQMNFHWCNIKK